MTETLRSYVCVLNYAPPGILSLGAWVAPDAAAAAAMAAMDAAAKMRHLDPFPALVNCLVVEEAAENLRARLHAIEGKPAGEVVSLVPGTSPPDNSDERLRADLDRLRAAERASQLPPESA